MSPGRFNKLKPVLEKNSKMVPIINVIRPKKMIVLAKFSRPFMQYSSF
jgi:hypothetical protein